MSPTCNIVGLLLSGDDMTYPLNYIIDENGNLHVRPRIISDEDRIKQFDIYLDELGFNSEDKLYYMEWYKSDKFLGTLYDTVRSKAKLNSK